MGSDNNIERWEKSTAQDFWGEIAPYHNIAQIYEEDQAFLDLLTDFVSNGINANDCVIVIATENHLKSLDTRLRANGFNVFDLTLRDQFIPLNVEMTLSRFMINGWPDELLFRHLITRLIDRAHMHKRKVRAFAELVAILWSQGLHEGTVRLEDLWNKFCETEAFCLFCAYPKTSFAQHPQESMMNICGAHRKVIAGWGMTGNEIMYKNIPDDRKGSKPPP